MESTRAKDFVSRDAVFDEERSSNSITNEERCFKCPIPKTGPVSGESYDGNENRTEDEPRTTESDTLISETLTEEGMEYVE